MAIAPTVLIYDDIAWDDMLGPRASADAPAAPSVKTAPRAMVEQAKKLGARRKKLARGEGGFYMNRSVMPAGFRVPPHSHNHDELIVVVKGSCLFDEGLAELGPDDSIVIRANYRYGFTCGAEGAEFLTIRTAEAGVSM